MPMRNQFHSEVGIGFIWIAAVVAMGLLIVELIKLEVL